MLSAFPHYHIDRSRLFFYRQVLHDQYRHLAVQDEIINHASIRPLIIARVTVRTERDHVDAFLICQLMQGRGRVIAG
jgi:hypothetical protein